jgi:polyhydroxyalkanoate synthase
VRGSELLRSVKDQEVEVGTTPKKEVFRIDKTVLYRYDAVAAPTIDTPVLVVYGLVGRYTMADLQEGPLARAQPARAGIDLYAGRLGQPVAHGSLAHDRRLRRRLSRVVRRAHLRGARD